MSTTVESGTEIRPFHVEFADEAIDDLCRGIAATRWPTKELVSDRSQGVQFAAARALARYWLDDYDFGRVEARLNALPQFVTGIITSLRAVTSVPRSPTAWVCRHPTA